MVELSQTSGGLLKQSYAGDAYNTAVYLKRMFSEVQVNFFTTVGEDQLSDNMVTSFESEQIGTDLVFRAKDKAPGLYMIDTDDDGERSFTYWRECSAARQAMQFVTAEVVGQLCMGDVFFFSGISLAVIEPNDREIFWLLMRKLKDTGVKIAFDPNYRARMWKDKTEAKIQFERAFRMADLVLPGIEDFTQLYGFDDLSSIKKFCGAHGIDELIIKNGAKSVYCMSEQQVQEIEISPVSGVVDTTSAGDSFNGGYMGARLQGLSIADSVAVGATVAGFVILHPGAIVPNQTFTKFNEQIIQPALLNMAETCQ